MVHAPLEDKAAEAELVLARVRVVLGERVGWGDVENQLVLEVVQDDDDEAGDAAEG